MFADRKGVPEAADGLLEQEEEPSPGKGEGQEAALRPQCRTRLQDSPGGKAHLVINLPLWKNM